MGKFLAFNIHQSPNRAFTIITTQLNPIALAEIIFSQIAGEAIDKGFLFIVSDIVLGILLKLPKVVVEMVLSYAFPPIFRLDGQIHITIFHYAFTNCAVAFRD